LTAQKYRFSLPDSTGTRNTRPRSATAGSAPVMNSAWRRSTMPHLALARWWMITKNSEPMQIENTNDHAVR
jgi:hypothetical protein